jgi:acetylornithine deacetylase/succinyl-diaminopimelate desuccinylase-like protein
VRLEGRTPLILIDIPGEGADCVLLYGHLDKQPEMVGWAEGYGPWLPRLEGDKLYGRGGADDGYAMFASLSALLAMREASVPHARAVILIEACEESGSYDLPFYVDYLADRIGRPSLVVCLHSGHASGIVPSSFRVLRQLLSRLEDEQTGEIRPAALYAQVPAERLEQAKRAALVLGETIWREFPLAGGTMPMAGDLTEMLLNRSWRPQLAVTGIDGLPPPGDAGNVLLPYTTAKLSLRLPPTVDAEAAGGLLKDRLERDPPYGAAVEFAPQAASAGWNAPALAPWLARSLARASEAAFGRPPAFIGEGGSIPFMAMLGEKFPQAQFVVTGVLGPHSNAHGPNEFLHIPMGRRVSLAIAQILADHYAK